MHFSRRLHYILPKIHVWSEIGKRKVFIPSDETLFLIKKCLYSNIYFFFLVFFDKNICCGYLAV